MSERIFELVNKEHLFDVLENLQLFTGLSIQLLDVDVGLLHVFGPENPYCALIKKSVFPNSACRKMHEDAGKRAHEIGEGYIFSCHANLSHIAFPLISGDVLLGCILIGPFLMDSPDSTLITSIAQSRHLTPEASLELYDELGGLPVLPPPRVNQLKKLMDDLFSPLLSADRLILLRNQKRLDQQSRINETVQGFKDMDAEPANNFFYEKESALLHEVSSGNLPEVRALINELIGYVLFSEGRNFSFIRTRAVELNTLLSRICIENGMQPERAFAMSSQYLTRLIQAGSFDEVCYLLQNVVESFLDNITSCKDKGNKHVRKAMSYVAEHYAEHISLESAALVVGLSPNHFSNLFNKTVGTSFSSYLNGVRVEKSKKLLLDPELQLSEIAVAVGFGDQSYYSKVFKRVTGLTPGAFRR